MFNDSQALVANIDLLVNSSCTLAKRKIFNNFISKNQFLGKILKLELSFIAVFFHPKVYKTTHPSLRRSLFCIFQLFNMH